MDERRPHDLGGLPGAGKIDKSQREIEDWERLADALNAALAEKGIKTTDEHRRAIEDLEDYRGLGYYERWTAANEQLLIEKGILTHEEIDRKAAELSERWGRG